MKKYLIFAVSFFLLFFLFQVLSGIFLTTMYTPDMEEAWNSSATLPQETIITGGNNSFILPLLIAFLAATIAYFISRKLFKNREISK